MKTIALARVTTPERATGCIHERRMPAARDCNSGEPLCHDPPTRFAGELRVMMRKTNIGCAMVDCNGKGKHEAYFVSEIYKLEWSGGGHR